MAHHRALVITLVVAVVLAGVGIGVLALATNDTDESVQDELAAHAYGERLAASGQIGHLRITPDAKQFGRQPVNTTSAPFTFTISHDAPDKSALDLSLRFFGVGSFVLVADECTGERLVPGQTCTFKVLAAPKRVGDMRGQANILAKGGFLNAQLRLSGTAVPEG